VLSTVPLKAYVVYVQRWNRTEGVVNVSNYVGSAGVGTAQKLFSLLHFSGFRQEHYRVSRHIELSNDNPISEKFRNENDVTYEVDAFVHVVLGKV
jgi:hypothetical protein